MDYAIYINNAQYLKRDADGRYRFGWANEEAIWIYEKFAEMCREGYVVPEELNNQYQIDIGNTLIKLAGREHAGRAQNGDTIVYAPAPIGPHADRHTYPENAVKYTAIPVTAHDPAALIALHDFLYRKDDLDFDTWARES